MNIVDSSGWLAYFADEPNAKHFLAPLNDTDSLVVPTVTIYEVFKVVLRWNYVCQRLGADIENPFDDVFRVTSTPERNDFARAPNIVARASCSGGKGPGLAIPGLYFPRTSSS
ncbi:MAG: hypothetical protein JRJ29_12760 [Deltaproteobacteria bacterium]|nr:hypothetical protein [Deltaproteobacteria bacterium]